MIATVFIRLKHMQALKKGVHGTHVTLLTIADTHPDHGIPTLTAGPYRSVPMLPAVTMVLGTVSVEMSPV